MFLNEYFYSHAQDPGFPDSGQDPPGEVTIDGGVGLLIAAGVAYGVKKSKAKKNVDESKIE